MKYEYVLRYMVMFHLGYISKREMALVIHMWQRSNNYKVVEYDYFKML